MHRLLTTIICMIAATAAVAEPARLDTQALKSTFTGALVEMDTPAGTVIPVRFGKDGLVSGEAGVLASVLGAAHDRGRWWAANDELCVKWFRWFEAKTRCVSLRKDGTRIYWSGEEGRSGTGTISEPAPVVAAVPEPAPPAPTPPMPATQPTKEIAEAETAPAIAPTEMHAPETASGFVTAPSMRFASAALATISIMPPLAKEPSHLLDGDGRQAINTEPDLATAEGTIEPVSHPVQQQVAAAPQPPAPAVQVSAPRQQEQMSERTEASSSVVIRASYRVAGVADDDILNVRSGPALYYETVGELPPEGRGVRIVGPCRADWCPIRHGHTTGWVNRNFLAEDMTSSTAAAYSR